MNEWCAHMESLYHKVLKPFIRQTSSGTYLPQIDGLRCLAIMMVLLFHSACFFASHPNALGPNPTENPWGFGKNFIDLGWFGVQVFFVISGMVLALPFAEHYLYDAKKPLVSTYFKRRLIRIEIPYLISLTLFAMWLWRSGYVFAELLPRYLAGLIYSHTAIYGGELNPIMPVSWTLEIEIQFYLLAPFFCLVFSWKKSILRYVLLLVVSGLGVFFSNLANEVQVSGFWNHSLIGQCGYFAIGLLLAEFYLKRKREGNQSKSCLWDMVGVLSFWAAMELVGRDATWDVKPLLLGLSFWGVLYGRVLSWLFSLRWITAIGTMCYTIYLFHNVLIYGFLGSWFGKAEIPKNPGQWLEQYIRLAGLAIVAILLCAMIYMVLEKPFARGRIEFLKK